MSFIGRNPKISSGWIEGKGYAWIAKERIEKDEAIYLPYPDFESFDFPLSEILSWPQERRHKFFKKAVQVDDDVYNGYHSDLEISEDRKLDWNINHCCDPNCWYFAKDSMSARRTIEVGEEICYDYATTQANPKMAMTCQCKSKLCRGIIKGNDYQLSNLQELYKGHFLPYIQRKIDLLK